MKNKNLTPIYTVMQCLYWMGFSAVMGLTSVYMLKCGFSSTQTGLLIAAAGLLSTVLQPVAAAYADNPKGPGLKAITLFSVALVVLSGVGMLLFAGRAGAVLIFFGLCICLMQLLTPLLNALGVGGINSGHRVNVGFARGLASLGYAASVSVLGTVVEMRGANTVPVCIVLFLSMFFLCTVFYPRPAAAGEGKTSGGSALAFFRKYPRYCPVLVGVVMLFVSHVLVNSFAYQVAIVKGGDSRETGIAMGLAAAIEIPAMVGSSWLFRRRGAAVWFRLAGIFMTLKSLGTLLVPNVAGYYAVQIFQMGGWGLIAVSSIFYIDSIMEPGDAVKGQAYYGMAYTLGTVIGAVLGGWLIDAMGVNAMLTFATAVSAVGAAVVLYFARSK